MQAGLGHGRAKWSGQATCPAGRTTITVLERAIPSTGDHRPVAGDPLSGDHRPVVSASSCLINRGPGGYIALRTKCPLVAEAHPPGASVTGSSDRAR